jgi:hypothetical protein
MKAPIQSIVKDYETAYLRMAREANYRPGAPGDGMGGIYLTREQLASPDLLQREADRYAEEFYRREETGKLMGYACCDGRAATAFLLTIEAAHLQCSGIDGFKPALKLLQMAAQEMRLAMKGSGR